MTWRFGVCYISSLFLGAYSLFFLSLGIYFCLNDLCYFVDWHVCTLNTVDIVMTFLFDWMSLVLWFLFLL